MGQGTTAVAFSTAAIASMDGGRIAAAIDAEIKKAAMDCEDRPGEKRPRRVTLQLDLVPVTDEAGLAESCSVQARIIGKHPERKSKRFDMGLRRNGVLVHSEETEEADA